MPREALDAPAICRRSVGVKASFSATEGSSLVPLCLSPSRFHPPRDDPARAQRRAQTAGPVSEASRHPGLWADDCLSRRIRRTPAGSLIVALLKVCFGPVGASPSRQRSATTSGPDELLMHNRAPRTVASGTRTQRTRPSPYPAPGSHATNRNHSSRRRLTELGYGHRFHRRARRSLCPIRARRPSRKGP